MENEFLVREHFDPNEKLPLFVIGAGASTDFGYPTGDELKKQIKKFLTQEVTGLSSINLNAICKSALEKQTFVGACRILNESIDYFPTIDACIHFHSKDNIYIKRAGYCAIVRAIFDLEFNSESLFKSADELRTKDSWLDSYFKLMAKHLEKEEAGIRLGRTPMIIFNYDRNVEKYMNYIHKKLFYQNSNFSGRIKHMYGVLPEKSEFAIKDETEIWSENIITHTDLREYSFSADRGVSIFDVETIIFLGFGYDEKNMRAISQRVSKEPKNIFGTIHGLNEGLKENLKETLFELFHADKKDIKLYDATCKEFFGNFSSIKDFKKKG